MSQCTEGLFIKINVLKVDDDGINPMEMFIAGETLQLKIAKYGDVQFMFWMKYYKVPCLE